MEKADQGGQFINTWRRSVTVGLVCVTWLLFAGSSAFGLDIATALTMAEQNDAYFKAKIMDSQAKNADGWALVAAMGPRVAVSGKLMRSRLDYSPEEIAELEERHLTFNDDEATLSLDQPLFDLEKIYRARRGGCEMDIAAMEQEKAREELIVRVVERYFSLLSAQDELDLANSKLQILESQLHTALASHDLGLGDQSDLFDSQARYEATRALLALQEAKLVDAREALSELLGVPVLGELEGLDAERFFAPPENDFDYWLKFAGEHNVDCRLSRLQAEAARLDGKIGSGRFLPSLSFFVEYERASPENDLNGYGWERERTDYGLKLQMELVSGGRDLADVVARDYRYKASQQRVIAIQRSIVRQTRSTWSSLQRILESIQAYEKAVAANKRSLQIKEAGYQEGLQTMPDVLNVQKDYFVTSNKYQNARYDYVITWTKFKQLVGDLVDIEADLEL